MSQNVIQKENCIRFDSGKIEYDTYGNNFASPKNLGGFSDIKISELWDDVEITGGNVGIIANKAKKQRVTIDGKWLEPELSKLADIRGGDLDDYDTNASAPVAVTDEFVTLTDTNYKRLAGAMGDGTEVGSIVVKTLADVAKVLNVDYSVGVDSDGFTCIARIAGGAFGDGDVVKVSYSYTPNANKTLKTGGSQTITPIELRFTNTNEDGKKWTMSIYKCFIKKGLDQSWLNEDATDLNSTPLSFEGKLDTSRAIKDQLFNIVDEQGV